MKIKRWVRLLGCFHGKKSANFITLHWEGFPSIFHAFLFYLFSSQILSIFSVIIFCFLLSSLNALCGTKTAPHFSSCFEFCCCDDSLLSFGKTTWSETEGQISWSSRGSHRYLAMMCAWSERTSDGKLSIKWILSNWVGLSSSLCEIFTRTTSSWAKFQKICFFFAIPTHEKQKNFQLCFDCFSTFKRKILPHQW